MKGMVTQCFNQERGVLYTSEKVVTINGSKGFVFSVLAINDDSEYMLDVSQMGYSLVVLPFKEKKSALDYLVAHYGEYVSLFTIDTFNNLMSHDNLIVDVFDKVEELSKYAFSV